MRNRSFRYDLILVSHGMFKVNCIKVLRDIVPHFGLKEALEFVNQELPAVVLTNISDHKAKRFKKQLEAVGAKVKARDMRSKVPFKPGKKLSRVSC